VRENMSDVVEQTCHASEGAGMKSFVSLAPGSVDTTCNALHEEAHITGC
jgi:hypothetical protein